MPPRSTPLRTPYYKWQLGGKSLRAKMLRRAGIMAEHGYFVRVGFESLPEKVRTALRLSNPHEAEARRLAALRDWRGKLNLRKYVMMARAAGISKQNTRVILGMVELGLKSAGGDRALAISWLKEYSERVGGLSRARARVAIHFLQNLGKTLTNPYVEYKSHLSQHRGPWKCTECGAILKTDKAAQAHKFRTGHSSYTSVLKNPLVIYGRGPGGRLKRVSVPLTEEAEAIYRRAGGKGYPSEGFARFHAKGARFGWHRLFPNPAYSARARAFLARKIPTLIREGYGQARAIAIGLKAARRAGLKVPKLR